jgi:hypothetical protein
VCAIFAVRAGELIEMDEQPFAAERDLQGYLEAHPELLSAEAAEDDRRSWLLVRREMGVADREDAGDRWSLDHLFVDQDAIPTFVEVKRSSNTEIRRKVVGQMLDYAANASAYWDAGRLRSSFESRFNSAEAAAEEFADFIEGEQDADEFWDAVAGHLEERRLRLVFVADCIPPELRSIVEFLNEQLNLTEVIAVEVKQYVERDGEQANIVPRVIGETEMARRVKRAGGGARRPRANEERFYAETRAAYAPELAERVLALYEYARARGSRRTFGRAKSASTTVWMGEDEDPEIANPVAVRFGERHVTVLMRHLRSRRTPEEMTRLVQLFRRLPGTSHALDEAVAKDYRTVSAFPADEVLATDKDLEEFKRVLDDAAVRMPAGA